MSKAKGLHLYAFCATTLALTTACAGAPAPDPIALAAAQSQCETLAAKYAQVVRDAGEATARYGSSHPGRRELDRLQISLRSELTVSGAVDVERTIARALGAELAEAKAERALLEARYGKQHLQIQATNAGMQALETALEAERSGRS